MYLRECRSFFAITFFLLLATNVVASETQNSGVSGDWSYFISSDACWAASARLPEQSKHSRNGKSVEDSSVNRGKGPVLYVSYFKNLPQETKLQVSFWGGNFEFETEGKKVDEFEINIKGTVFKLKPHNSADGAYAFSLGSDADSKIISSMKAGADAAIKSVSKRGTVSVDVFSLMGLTKAIDEIQKACK